MTKEEIEGEHIKIPLHCRNEQKYLHEIDVSDCKSRLIPTCKKIENSFFLGSYDSGLSNIKSLDECQKEVYKCSKNIDNCRADHYKSNNVEEPTFEATFFQGAAFYQGKCYHLWGHRDDKSSAVDGAESCKFEGKTECGTDKALC